MKNESYDAIIIGAGIHGAGCAAALSEIGYRTLVLEKAAVAAGTSSRSSKLIHGGLRYLESGQFSLVRECLTDRRRLLQQYPDLVKMIPFHIPVYADSSRPSWKIAAGLGLYGLLTGFSSYARFRRLAKSQWGELDQLKSRGLRSVYQYWDAQTDDAALTRRVMADALASHCRLLAPAMVSAIEETPHRCLIHYQYQQQSRVASAAAVINAAGPWCNQVLKLVSPTCKAEEIELVQGTHILVNRALAKGAYYLEAPQDRRAVFVMPWTTGTLVGTTETVFHGTPDQVTPLQTEIDYLRRCYEHYFGKLSEDAITGSFAGLRVLPRKTGTVFHRPRETRLHRSPLGRIITIYGGKLTAFRSTAQRVLACLPMPQRE